jgi:hypothetical protein
VIMFVGQVETTVRSARLFRSSTTGRSFGSMTKWTVEFDDSSRITEFVSRAFYIASVGRPGPVVVAQPATSPRSPLPEAHIAPEEPRRPALVWLRGNVCRLPEAGQEGVPIDDNRLVDRKSVQSREPVAIAIVGMSRADATAPLRAGAAIRRRLNEVCRQRNRPDTLTICLPCI